MTVTKQQRAEAKELAARLRADIGVTGPRSKVYGGAWKRIGITATGPDSPWPYGVTTAVYGIQWARKTGRVSAEVQHKLRALSDWQWCTLIADVALACTTQGEVPRFLINRYVTPLA